MRAATIPMGFPLAFLALALVLMAVICWRAAMAERHAHRLLRGMLTDAEYHQLTNRGYLEVASPSAPQRAYRIPYAGGRVRMYERGCVVCELCLRSTKWLPQSDILLLHKLMIESDEASYLATANHFAPPADAHVYGIFSLRARIPASPPASFDAIEPPA
jgi:hypothetical protein